MKLLSTKSAIRYLLPNGTAGLLRSVLSGRRRAPPPAGGDEGPEVVLGLVDFLPGPFGVLVHPDAVVSSLAPGSLEERDRLTRRMCVEIPAGGDRGDLLRREAGKDLGQPPRAF